MSRSVVVALFALLLIAAAAGFWWVTSAHDRATQLRVKAVLTDPDSAVFEGLVYNEQRDIGCGVVNARNRMGGMVGFRAFVAFPDGEVRFQPELGHPGGEGWQTIALVSCARDEKSAMAFWGVVDRYRYQKVQ